METPLEGTPSDPTGSGDERGGRCRCAIRQPTYFLHGTGDGGALHVYNLADSSMH